MLGESVLGSGRRFDLDVRVGAGAYICGEETSMLESLEGRRGEVRAKPPIPALEGLFGRPTVVNNVLTLGAVPMVLADGGEAYAALGTGRSRGTQVFQLAGNVARGGIVEADFGVSLGELVEDFGGGTASGRPVKAVQVGGPLGRVPAARRSSGCRWTTRRSRMPARWSGTAASSCGTTRWTPRRWPGSRWSSAPRSRAASAPRAASGRPAASRSSTGCAPRTDDGVRRTQLVLLEDLCTTMAKGSLCAMGGLTPMPVRSALEHFPEDFGVPRRHDGGSPAMTIIDEAALETPDRGTPAGARRGHRARDRSTASR